MEFLREGWSEFTRELTTPAVIPTQSRQEFSPFLSKLEPAFMFQE
jgi:hypothetical protein